MDCTTADLAVCMRAARAIATHRRRRRKLNAHLRQAALAGFHRGLLEVTGVRTRSCASGVKALHLLLDFLTPVFLFLAWNVFLIALVFFSADAVGVARLRGRWARGVFFGSL